MKFDDATYKAFLEFMKVSGGAIPKPPAGKKNAPPKPKAAKQKESPPVETPEVDGSKHPKEFTDPYIVERAKIALSQKFDRIICDECRGPNVLAVDAIVGTPLAKDIFTKPLSTHLSFLLVCYDCGREKSFSLEYLFGVGKHAKPPEAEATEAPPT